MTKLIVVVALAVISSSCKTSESDGAMIVDGTSMPGDMDTTRRQELSNVPVTLWSPGQRRAMAGYYYLAGEMIGLENRDPRKSLEAMETAYGLDPTPFLGAKMIAAKAQAGKGDEALLEARKMVLLFPNDAHLRYLFGQLLLSAGQLADAIDQLERCIGIDPVFEGCYQDLLQAHQVSRETTKAIVVAKEMTEKIPNSVTAWTVLSRLYLSQGDNEKALDPARRAYEMQSSNPHLIQVYALALQLNGNSKKAIWLYEKLFRMNPTDETIMTRMVELYREIGNLKDAAVLVDKLIAEEPSNHALRVQKAILLWEMEKFAEASELLDNLAAEFPSSVRLLYMSGLGQERLKDYDRALKTYRSIPEDSPFYYQGGLRQMIVLKEQKQTEAAIEFGKQLTESPNVEWDLFGLIGNMLSDEKRYSEAVEILGAGYQRFPEHPRLLFLKGVYQERSGDVDACIATMRLVIERDADNSSAYNYLGYLFADRGENLDEAESLIKKALEIKPGDGFYLDSLGWVYFQRGEYDQALPHLLEAVKVQPKEGVIYEHIGDVKKATQHIAEAVENYKKALSVDLEDKDRARVEEKLKELSRSGDRAEKQP